MVVFGYKTTFWYLESKTVAEKMNVSRYQRGVIDVKLAAFQVLETIDKYIFRMEL